MRTITLMSICVLAVFILTSCTIGQAQLQSFQKTTPLQRINILTNEPVGPSCYDSDSTLSYGDDTHYTSGLVTTPLGTDYDACKEEMLIEYFCEFGHKKHDTTICPYGCFDGACLIKPMAEPSSRLLI